MSYDYRTSRPAFEEAKLNINDKQLAVYRVINQSLRINDREIAEKLQWPINRVTPRRGELVDAGHIESAGVFLDPASGRKVNYWKIKSQIVPLKQGILWQ